MMALVMAGGKGSRMNMDTEKLLLKYKKPVVLHVIDALQNSKCFEKIFAVTSPNAPKTQELLYDSGIPVIETKGEGYVQDLNLVLNQLSDSVLIVSGDLPFLDEEIIKKIISKQNLNYDWLSFVVTKDFLDSVGLSEDFSIKHDEQQCFYTGISIVNANKIKSLDSIKEHYEIINDKKIAFNLNTKREYDLLGVA